MLFFLVDSLAKTVESRTKLLKLSKLELILFWCKPKLGA